MVEQHMRVRSLENLVRRPIGNGFRQGEVATPDETALFRDNYDRRFCLLEGPNVMQEVNARLATPVDDDHVMMATLNRVLGSTWC